MERGPKKMFSLKNAHIQQISASAFTIRTISCTIPVQVAVYKRSVDVQFLWTQQKQVFGICTRFPFVLCPKHTKLGAAFAGHDLQEGSPASRTRILWCCRLLLARHPLLLVLLCFIRIGDSDPPYMFYQLGGNTCHFFHIETLSVCFSCWRLIFWCFFLVCWKARPLMSKNLTSSSVWSLQFTRTEGER